MMTQLPVSHKDRSGFVFMADGSLYRQVNVSYQKHYQKLIASGLYNQLVDADLLVSHKEIEKNFTGHKDFYITLQPQLISLINYPYEWSFSQLKDAALLTLTMMELAIGKGMILKDATPYNIQFVQGKPLFIDTLSFEIYDEEKPWVAYHQFCTCFLYPLLLAKYGVMDIHKIFTAYPEGILANKTIALMPQKTKWNVFNYLHLFLAEKLNKTHKAPKQVRFSKVKMRNLVAHLKTKIQGLEKKKRKTVWNTYYSENLLSDAYLKAKEAILTNWAKEVEQQNILDIGCNDGYFSLLFARNNNRLVCCDADTDCIDDLHRYIQKNRITNLQPLCIDVLQPSPDQGFFNKERKSFFNRVEADLVLMLAIVHHLVISKNLNFELIAQNMAVISKRLIIEFVPKTDVKVQQLLLNKKDVFTDYSQEEFEKIFSQYFIVEHKELVTSTERVLYFFKNKSR